MAEPVVGALALQGAFREHIQMFHRLGVKTRELRQTKDLEGITAVVLPGGESTTIGKLLNDLEMMAPLKEKIAAGMPAFGTCAGLILLCRDIEASAQPRLGLLNAVVRRNAFGRQVDSFEVKLPIAALGPAPYPAVFIRAPVILKIDSGVEALAYVERGSEAHAVAVRQKNILGASFHPELTNDLRLHKYFLEMIKDCPYGK